MNRVVTIFNGVYTIQNLTTGDHRTFNIRTQPHDATFAPNRRIIALLDGPDNNSNYRGFGFVEDDGITVWNKYKGRNKKSNFDWFALMIWHIATGQPCREFDHSKYKLHLEGKCIRCNRRLSTPNSIETGIGPICAGIKND